MTGIPITVALKKISERDQMAERHKFFPQENGEDHLADEILKKVEEKLAAEKLEKIEEQLEAESGEAMIKAIESDFHQEAEQILDLIDLSHLRPKTKTPTHGNIQ